MQGHGSGRRAALGFRAAGVVLLVAHLTFVLWLTLRPLTALWVTATPPEPLGTIRADLALGPWAAVRHLGRGLLLLAPLGVLLPLAAGRIEVSELMSLARTTSAGAMVSLVVELARGGRTGQAISLDAVLLNTAGVALAYLAVVPAARAVLRRRDDRERTAGAARGAGAGARGEGERPVAAPIRRVGTAP
ncbi:VanZ family protein [Streptomyces sp. B1866]|uniref:VanZ family protein n=1 Tax=Streptomyces sp. B1866 TaxID=3075431 RepID=UPI0028906563|nr:VanZ family protein [Streptomyces sp. B1866]MDT3400346.1 VanZ family protein [Streptomyces sp. B1866]